MSNYGAIVRDPATLAVTWDSRSATAGVTMDYLTIAAGAEGFVKPYPGFEGRSARLVSMDVFGAVGGAALDFALGYPRLTVDSVPAFARSFMVVAL